MPKLLRLFHEIEREQIQYDTHQNTNVLLHGTGENDMLLRKLNNSQRPALMPSEGYAPMT